MMLDLETLIKVKATLAELEQTRILMYQAVMQAKATATDPAYEGRDYLRTTISQFNAHHEVLTQEVQSLTALARRMLDQRKSAQETFNQGWAAGLKDLIDQLNGDEYADLRRALERIQKS